MKFRIASPEKIRKFFASRATLVQKKLDEASEGIRDHSQEANEPTTSSNWYLRTARACEQASDAVMCSQKGASKKLTKALASQLGVAGTSAGIFSIASLLGAASTGTAIGSLSGAAFTSAALAWIGGSVFMGSIVLGVATISGGIGAVFGAAWVSKKYLWGKERPRSALEQEERCCVEACLSLATAFRQEAKSDRPIDPVAARALHEEALLPVQHSLESIITRHGDWPILAKRRLRRTRDKIVEARTFLGHRYEKFLDASIGTVSAVFLQLLSEEQYTFTQREELVLNALRRSNTGLNDAPVETLTTYIHSLDPGQLAGLQNNVKGIYHELLFVDSENSDDDEYVAEIFQSTNQAGADVILTNITNGQTRELQLKATDYISYVKQHNQRYENIDVLVTDEVASSTPEFVSSGFTNYELNSDVDNTFDNLNGSTTHDLEASMAVAAMISLSRNIYVRLRGDSLPTTDKTTLIKEGMTAAGVAGLVSLIIG